MKNYLVIFFLSQFTLGIFAKNENLSYPQVDCKLGTCELAKRSANDNNCYGHFNIEAIAKDLETDQDDLKIEYWIDINNDGNGSWNGYDAYISQLSMNDYINGMRPLIQENNYADNKSQPFNASGIYPLGMHKIIWRVTDEDNNTAQCESFFEIRDCTSPIITLKPNILIFALSPTGEIEITADMLIQKVEDNCNSQSELSLYFNNDPLMKKIRITVMDFIDSCASEQLRVNLIVNAIDKYNNITQIPAIVIIEDTLNIVPSDPCLPLFKVRGSVSTIKNESILCNMYVYNSGGNIIEHLNSIENYKLNFIRSNQYNSITLKCYRNDDPLNGVSTQDIVLLRKHVLGKSKITNPYILLAADVNNSRSLTSSDISEMRKLILGITSEFAKVSSWGFTPADYVFKDTLEPWGSPQEKQINFTVNMTDHLANFVGYKMGDLSLNARASNVTNTSNRSRKEFNITINELAIEEGKFYSVPVYANQEIDLEAIQFTIQFDPDAIHWADLASSKLSLTCEDYNELNKNHGIVNLAWIGDNTIHIEPNDELFRINFIAKRSGLLSEFLQLNSSNTQMEASNTECELSLRFSISNDSLILNGKAKITNINFQNSYLSFYSNLDTELNVELFSLDGRQLLKQKVMARKGQNNINIPIVVSNKLILFNIEIKNTNQYYKMLVYVVN